MPYTLETDVELTEDTFFNTLSFNIPEEFSFSDFLPSILERYHIPNRSIKSINTLQLRNKKVKCTVKYCHIPLISLQGPASEQQIRVALHHMGIADNNIKSIIYQQFGLNNISWHVTMHDPNNCFDPDESFSQRDYERTVQKKLKELFGANFVIKYI